MLNIFALMFQSKLESTETTNVELQLENEKLREELARLTLLLNSSNDLKDSRNKHINGQLCGLFF